MSYYAPRNRTRFQRFLSNVGDWAKAILAVGIFLTIAGLVLAYYAIIVYVIVYVIVHFLKKF